MSQGLWRLGKLWVRDHTQELPDQSKLVEWGSGPRYRARAAVRKWMAETRCTGNWKYLLHAAEAYTGLRAMRECYRPLLEGWKPEPGWFDGPAGEYPDDDWLWDDYFEVLSPGVGISGEAVGAAGADETGVPCHVLGLVDGGRSEQERPCYGSSRRRPACFRLVTADLPLRVVGF